MVQTVPVGRDHLKIRRNKDDLGYNWRIVERAVIILFQVKLVPIS